MRQIEKTMIESIKNATKKAVGNTTVSNGSVFLHGNEIAKVSQADKEIQINLCGWVTKTTVSRLNTLLFEFTNYRLGIKQGQPVLYTNTGNHKIAHNDWVTLDMK